MSTSRRGDWRRVIWVLAHQALSLMLLSILREIKLLLHIAHLYCRHDCPLESLIEKHLDGGNHMREHESMPDLEDVLRSLQNTARQVSQTVGSSIVVNQIRRLEEQLREIGTGGTLTRPYRPTPDFINGGPVKPEPSVLPPAHKPPREPPMIDEPIRGPRPTQPGISPGPIEKGPSVLGPSSKPDRENDV